MLIEAEQWDRAVVSLYDTILQPDTLPSELAKLNRMLDSDVCHLLGLAPDGEMVTNILTEASYADSVADYANFVDLDPRRNYFDTQPIGAANRCSKLFNERFASRSAFYQDYLRPHGLRYIVGSCLYRSAAQTVFVGFNHGRGRQAFSDAEEAMFGKVCRHLSTVVASQIHTQSLSQAIHSGEQALSSLQQGVMGVNGKGRICYLNRYAEQHVPKSELESGALAEGGALMALVRRVRGDGLPHSALLAPQPPLPKQHVTAFPARPAERALMLWERRAEVVLVFNAGDRRASARPSQLIAWFGLTPAESRLAHELGAGCTVDQYASKYAISVATARTQLRAVLKKTRAPRLQDLIRLLASLPV
ncbi:helix-turn-helix transcriptional regulator [Pseudoduganella aquatica]|uniref:HTH luxR-type domain-containing protein n=1 Tax=Pseudoduganella aquatica TaxID=2660641 RepID=A0A7X4HBL3_9BURK|nr:helix-turn-helix transcriptional regulator [Pseudoduganella aquatica]MYN08175.1 hypothetical protein [Pseudoduganella aquatica]